MSRLDSLLDNLRAEFEAAYNRGFADGQAAMRARILNAASEPLPLESAKGQHSKLSDLFAPKPREGLAEVLRRRTGETLRAPRGAVGRMLAQILSERPGLTITEIEALAPRYDPEVALKSIGNELRRFDGSKYKRDNQLRWFLFDQRVELETAGKSLPAVGIKEGGSHEAT